MKKFITVFTLLLSVLLCSCAAVPDTAELAGIFARPYDAEVKIQNGDDVYAVSVAYDGSTLLFDFSEPALLCGVSYSFTESDNRIIYNGLSIPVDLNGAADKLNGGVLIWKNLLEAGGDYAVRRAGEQYVMTDGETEYRYDKETKTPAYIKSGDIEITFTSFRAKNDKTS